MRGNAPSQTMRFFSSWLRRSLSPAAQAFVEALRRALVEAEDEAAKLETRFGARGRGGRQKRAFDR